LAAADIPVARLHSTDSLLDDPHLRAVGFYPELDHPSEGRIRTLAPVGRYSATPTAIRRPTPRIGEQSVELLREAGYDDAAIERMLARGVTLQPEPPGKATKDSE
jgi:crotonobetainyl-CoA:carnitine CoA-transferase CaiB-like acyl-CoA transferase